MVLPIVTDGIIIAPRGYYNIVGGHDHRYSDPGVAGTLLNSWDDCELVNECMKRGKKCYRTVSLSSGYNSEEAQDAM